jgi:hypothetical protein
MTPAKPKPAKESKSKKRHKKTERQLLDVECMELLKQIVRLRDKSCVTPSSSCGGYLTASHWQKRGKQFTRYDLRNVACQCANHNARHNHYTSYYDAYMLRKYGGDVCLELAENASMTWKWSIVELRVIRYNLQKELEKLEG